MSFTSIVDSTNPKCMEGLGPGVKRQFDKAAGAPVLFVERLQLPQNWGAERYLAFQLALEPASTVALTLESKERARARFTLSPDCQPQKIASGQRLKLPGLGLGFFCLWLDLEAFGGGRIRSVELSACRVLRIFTASFCQVPTAFCQGIYPQPPAEGFKELPRALRTPAIWNSLLIDRQVVQKMYQAGRFAYEGYEEFCNARPAQADQKLLKELGDAGLLQIVAAQESGDARGEKDQEGAAGKEDQQKRGVAPTIGGKEQKSVVKSVVDEKKPAKGAEKLQAKPQPAVRKKIRSYKDFQQWEGSEHSGDYDFEDLELAPMLFEITYQLEDLGQDDQDPRQLTPVKVKGQKKRRQKLIGVRMHAMRAPNVDVSQYVVTDPLQLQELGVQEKPKRPAFRDIEVSDSVDEEMEAQIRKDLNLPEFRKDMKDYQEFLNSGETTIRAYLVNELTDEQRQVIKQGILSGKYKLDAQDQAVRFGLVYDRINQRYFEMEYSDD